MPVLQMLMLLPAYAVVQQGRVGDYASFHRDECTDIKRKPT